MALSIKLRQKLLWHLGPFPEIAAWAGATNIVRPMRPTSGQRNDVVDMVIIRKHLTAPVTLILLAFTLSLYISTRETTLSLPPFSFIGELVTPVSLLILCLINFKVCRYLFFVGLPVSLGSSFEPRRAFTPVVTLSSAFRRALLAHSIQPGFGLGFCHTKARIGQEVFALCAELPAVRRKGERSACQVVLNPFMLLRSYSSLYKSGRVSLIPLLTVSCCTRLAVTRVTRFSTFILIKFFYGFNDPTPPADFRYNIHAGLLNRLDVPSTLSADTLRVREGHFILPQGGC